MTAVPSPAIDTTALWQQLRTTRSWTESICRPLSIEDYVVQPVDFVSPPKWHLGHTTWFFEEFILTKYLPGYKVYDEQFSYVFNSYYEAAGDRVIRTNRGNLSRPTVKEIYQYRAHVDEGLRQLLQAVPLDDRLAYLLQVGCNHEQQHQELLITDIKYILGHNPLLPAYGDKDLLKETTASPEGYHEVSAGLYTIGHDGDSFCYDNELDSHQTYVQNFSISTRLVTNEEYLSFIEADGYTDHRYWHSEGWAWVQEHQIKAPMYWHHTKSGWQHYTLHGMKPIDLSEPVAHISYYEAAAFAEYLGQRLPTEFEWEVAADHLQWGDRWEWTSSSYMPYPGFEKEKGALGEYNGKFMVNQQTLRGASVATAPNHSRKTYRNFFHADMRWQFTGIRLAKK